MKVCGKWATMNAAAGGMLGHTGKGKKKKKKKKKKKAFSKQLFL